MQRVAWRLAGSGRFPRNRASVREMRGWAAGERGLKRGQFEGGYRLIAENGGHFRKFFRLAEAGTEGATGGAAGCRCRRGDGDLDEHLIFQPVRTHRTPLARHFITLAACRPHQRPRTDPDTIPHCFSVLSLATATNSVHLDVLGRIGENPLLYGLPGEGRISQGSALGWGYGRSLVARTHRGGSPAGCAAADEF